MASMLINGLSPDRSIIPTTDDELFDLIVETVGIQIPRTAVCPNHVSPFQALADAYFVRAPMTVWKASRGFGGKSMLLAVLSFMEATTLGAAVNLLGGSGKQSKNVHDYMTGEHENVPDTFWKCPGAPRDKLITDPSMFSTRLNNRGRIDVLMASSKSVRGGHPSKLRCDEVDEISLQILDAALGQPQESRGILEQTVLSSTHQYADGTMTEVLRRAEEKGWPIAEWCYRETMATDGWLTDAQVQRKKRLVTAAMWETEYELQDPEPGARAIRTDAVAEMFKASLGEYEGTAGEYIEIEKPDKQGFYATGADWAKKQDWTIIVTVRVDVKPLRIVAFERMGRTRWPMMVGRYNDRLKRYRHPMVTIPGVNMKRIGSKQIAHPIVLAAHDETGIGGVVNDYIEFDVMPVQMVGMRRSNMLSGYISGIENGRYVSPFIKFMEREHRLASVDSVYGRGHLPDTLAAMSCLDYMLSRPITMQRTKYEPVRIGQFA